MLTMKLLPVIHFVDNFKHFWSNSPILPQIFFSLKINANIIGEIVILQVVLIIFSVEHKATQVIVATINLFHCASNRLLNGCSPET